MVDMQSQPASTANLDGDAEKRAVPVESESSDSDATDARLEDAPPDSNLVDWDGPEDLANPKNWPESKKWINIGMISILALLTPLGSSMFAPGVPEIMQQFHTTSSYTATFVVSIYVLGFAFGPLLAAPLSEIYGRVPLYHISNVLFVAFTIGAAFSNNMGMLLAFRFLMGFSGSVPLTNGTGTIADLFAVEKRGRAIAIWAVGPLLGPCIGPVAGGYLIQAEGWQWTFRVIAIMAGLLTVLCFFVLKETFAPALLQKKVRRLRKETGNAALRSHLDSGRSQEDIILSAIVRPLKLLFTNPVIALMSLYIAVAFAILYLMISTFSFVYMRQYHFTAGNIGLSYIPQGLGTTFGTMLIGPLTDRAIIAYKAKGIEIRPEHRLLPWLTIPSALSLPVGLFIYGWTTDKSVHWIAPMIGVFVFGIGMMGTMMCTQTYLLDAYPQYAASVTAAMTVLRCVAGALLPLGGLRMYDTLGLGWGNSLLAFIALGLTVVLPLFYVFGARIRTRFPVHLE